MRGQYLLEAYIIGIEFEIHVDSGIFQFHPTVDTCLNGVEANGIVFQCILVVGKIGVYIHLGGDVGVCKERNAIHLVSQ